MHQQSLYPETQSRFEKWLEFHRDNPAVWEQFQRFARLVRATGKQRFGARALWERMRWYFAFEVQSGTDYQLNDHHVPYYARLLMLRFPQEFAGFFETRSARFDIDETNLLRGADQAEQQRAGTSEVGCGDMP